jgi:2-keto-3-deoxy-L-rhamnonate aldolase RhmA
MRTNHIRALLNEGSPTLGTHLFLIEPAVVEMVGRTGAFDYVEFLGEYASYDLRELDNFCRAAELHDLGTMIKVDWEHRGFVAQRSVGAGFESVLFADPRSADDVRNCVRSVRPDTPEYGGTFGAGARRHALPHYGGGALYVDAVSQVVAVMMIEKASAVEQLDEILAIDGVDMVQWGPADYAMSIGRPGELSSKAVRDAEQHVLACCLTAGVPARAEISSVEDAKRYLDLGIRHFCIGYDLYVLHDILKDRGERLRAAITDGG